MVTVGPDLSWRGGRPNGLNDVRDTRQDLSGEGSYMSPNGIYSVIASGLDLRGKGSNMGQMDYMV